MNEHRSRTTDPETSKEAGRKVTNLRASQALVLNMFRAYGEMNDKDLLDRVHATQRDLGLTKVMSPSGVRSRRAELVTLGKVKDTGHRENVDGRNVIVWGIV